MKNMILTREVQGLAEYDLDAPELRFPAQILHGNRMTDAELFEIVQSNFARQSASLKMEDIYFIPAEISNQNLDSYFTKMAESSLRNYAADASAGVAFQNSHKRDLGVGYVFRGEYLEQPTPKVLADIYTVRGLKLNADLDTDNFIKGVEAGLIRDVSIGFKAGPDYKETCNLCHNPFWSYDCRHIAGMMYEIADDPNSDPTNQETNEQMAFVWIENARLSEVSAVYDGSTPDAMIITKARREGRAGRLPESIRMEIQKRFHVDVNEPRRTFSGSDHAEEIERQTKTEDNNRSETEMTDIEKALERALEAEKAARDAESKAAEADARAVKAETELASANARCADLESAIRDTADGIEEIEVTAETPAEDVARSVKAHIQKIAPKASQVEALRTSAIDDALASGVRAFGDDFDQDKKRSTLEKLDLVEIAETGKDWEARAAADGKFTGGRKSADDGDDPPADADSKSTRKIDTSIPATDFARI